MVCFVALTLPGIVGAQSEGPVERTVVTRDGAMYRGEVKEYVVGDHITLKVDSGEVYLIAWADAVQISPPRSKTRAPGAEPPRAPTPGSDRPPVDDRQAPPPARVLPPPMVNTQPVPAPVPAPTPVTGRTPAIINNQPVPTPVAPNTERTVVTQGGITYNGEVREFESGSHILLMLANGERRRIPWAEAKRISPAHVRGDSDPVGSPERTVVMADGANIRGELVESQIGEYTTLKLPGGTIRRIAWRDAKRILMPNPTGRPSPIPMTGEILVVTDTGKRIQGEYFEYVADDHLVLRHASGGFRFIPVGAITKIVVLGENSQ